MLPLDPTRHEDYREKLRVARARQVKLPTPKGTKLSEQRCAAIKAGVSAKHRSRNQRGQFNANWTGAGWVHHTGYQYITNADGEQITEHRDVMQRKLGRKLFAHETVHHRNGDRLDNRIENLELWSTANPKGQRVEDKVQYALEILATYRPAMLDGVFIAPEDLTG